MLIIVVQSQRLLHMLEVHQQLFARALAVAPADVLDDVEVLVVLAGAGVRGVVQREDQAAERNQATGDVDEQAVARELGQQQVEIPGQPGKGGVVMRQACGTLLGEMRLKALERENRELRQANEILRKASAYFAQAELDRPFRR